MSEDERDPNRKRVADVCTNPPLLGSPGNAALDVNATCNNGGKVGAIVSAFEPPAPPSPNPVRDPKRKKTTEEERSNANAEVAGSMEGRRPDQ
jgi:hypothetical protein